MWGAASHSRGSSAECWGNDRKWENEGGENNNKKAAFPPLQAANLLALSGRLYPQPRWCLVAIALSPTSPLAPSPMLLWEPRV